MTSGLQSFPGRAVRIQSASSPHEFAVEGVRGVDGRNSIIVLPQPLQPQAS